MTRQRILSGDRPTGRLHLGHLVGSLEQRVALQHTHQTTLIIADLHTLTTRPRPEEIGQIPAHTRGIVLDYLAAGIDPEKADIYLQSAVPQTYELNALLANLTTLERLQRIPSLKEMAQNAGQSTMSFGLLAYPVLQAADILLSRAQLVPVGQDNLPAVELAQEIAKRFNRLYGRTFERPRALLSDVPSLVGTCGKRKMSKSAQNAIFLSDPSSLIAKKIRRMFTDPNRIHAHVRGETEKNPVFVYHRRFNDDPSLVRDLEARYRAGKIADAEVKELLFEALQRYLAPIRARMTQYESQPELIERILHQGTERMRERAERTMRTVRRAMGINRVFAKLSSA